MNIKITHNWLLEYLKTDADPYEIQKYLSLCGPSVERVEKINNNYVYDIEITSNRIDTASVFGIAQEAQAILPQFGKKAKLRFNPLEKYKFPQINAGNTDQHSLQVQIKNPDLCSRFTAIVLSEVSIQDSPDFIKERLQLCDMKSINNIVDISNYLMLGLGQPTHIFDYDKIGKKTMIMRESRKGESIITLDGKKVALPGKDIVIEDGDAKLIDLCGIMGGLNSSVFSTTKNIVLFVQTYNKQAVRRTSMFTGVRTVAATYFEKGLDEERVGPTLSLGVELLQKYAKAKVSSKIYDIYPHAFKQKRITVSQSDIKRIIGVEIDKDKIINILGNLGFSVETHNRASLQYIVFVPSFRRYDVTIKEDIIEEIARVYGYFNLPNRIQSTIYIKQPKDMELLFSVQQKVKYFLKYLGVHEVMNYSMISKQQLQSFDLNPKNHLRLANTISSEIEYLRTSLLPSLIKNIKDNEGKKDILKFFEIAKVYLPTEIYKLGIIVNTDLLDLKGMLDTLFKELNIKNYQIRESNNHFFSSNMQGQIVVKNKNIGVFGELNPIYLMKTKLKQPAFLAEIDFQSLIQDYKLMPFFKPINPYSVVKLDLTIELTPQRTYNHIEEKAFETAKLLCKIEFISLYHNKATLRFYFSSTSRNITEEEAKEELQKIKVSV